MDNVVWLLLLSMTTGAALGEFQTLGVMCSYKYCLKFICSSVKRVKYTDSHTAVSFMDNIERVTLLYQSSRYTALVQDE